MENNPFGGMAQLGARLTGSQKVRGSNPLISTKMMKDRDDIHGLFWWIFSSCL